MIKKVIVITGYWKSGTTLLQFLLAKHPNIDNIFPRDDINYDGHLFWKKYLPPLKPRNGHTIPKELYEKINKKEILNQLESWAKTDTILLKRPQFVDNIDFLQYLFEDYDLRIIGMKRDIIPNIYSMMKLRKRNGYGIKILSGHAYYDCQKDVFKPPLKRLCLQYKYANESLDRDDIFIYTYEDICDNTEQSAKDIGNYIGEKLDWSNVTVENKNMQYKTGANLRSDNEYTSKNILCTDEREKDFPPFTSRQLQELKHYMEELCLN